MVLRKLKRRLASRTMRAAASRFAVMLAMALVAAMALSPGSALAGAYHVYSCRMPSGESAPADGWSGSLAAGGAYDDYVMNTCANGGSLIAALGDGRTHLANIDRATWTFSAPVGETIGSATLWRSGDVDGGSLLNAFYQFWLAGPSEMSVFDECINTLKCVGQGELNQPLSNANRVEVPSRDLGANLYTNTSCGGVLEYSCPADAGDPNGYAAAVYLYAADITLEQSEGPTADNVSGELASAPTVQGTSDLTFSATDPGSGVYEAVFTVDGQVVQSTVVNENGGRCRNVGQTTDGLPAFLYVQPCLQTVSADVPFNTTGVSNGTHHLVVSVIDPAGNAAPVLDRQITVDNSPSPCAQGAAANSGSSSQATLSVAWKGSKSERITAAFGRTNIVLGRLTRPSGTPIAGATVEMVATPALAGASAVTVASPRTDLDGRFSVRVPGGQSSRQLCFAYRNAAGGEQGAVTRTLTLNVRAGITLTIAPRTASIGHSVHFSGRLLGRPLPPDGKQLVLEARSPGTPWLEFDVVRTGARGRYRASYRFKFPGPAHYQFRVVAEPESDYPFARGTSNVLGVRER